MSELKTSEQLLKAISDAARRGPTASELRNQRVSFIMGSLDKKSGVTREQVRKVLAAQDGR